ncbi:MAG: hypothetical protein LC650_02570 [Actinobacteria bacterium]|nr:hypothetical protein [Actinomycetota bacterium]
MIKPEELREFMPRYRDYLVVEVFERGIIAAAENDQTSWKIDRVYFWNSGLPQHGQVEEWVQEAIKIGYRNSTDRGSNPVLRALKQFEDNGFKVEFFYEENQFVDMGFRISWEG